MKKLSLVLLFLISCDPPPAPHVPPPPAVRLPPEIETSIASLKEEERTVAQRKQALEGEIHDLQAKKIEIEAATGKARYMLKLQIKQSHFSLDLDEHLKDAMNKAEFWIAVDREMYDSSNPGSEILDKFRVGSLIMNGSIGSWKIKVLEKKIVEK